MQNNFKSITVKKRTNPNDLTKSLICYPIQYKGNQYTIVIKQNRCANPRQLYLSMNVYEYKNTIWHKGTLVYSKICSAIQLEDNKFLNIETTKFDEIFPRHLPYVLNALFKDYEISLKEEEEKEKSLLPVYEWNGIIEDKSSSNTEAPSFETGAYVNWLENMLTMLSKNYIDLIHASSEEVVKSVTLPRQNEIRKAIRLISENAVSTHEWVEEKTVEFFTQELIEKQRRKNNG